MPINVFISYARAESAFVDRLASDLRECGIAPWVDTAELLGGDDWRDSLEDAIRNCEAMIIVCTPDAVNSKWVRGEYHYADSWGKVRIPLLVKDCKLPMDLISLQHVDFQHSYEDGLANLLKTLHRRSLATHDAMALANAQEESIGQTIQIRLGQDTAHRPIARRLDSNCDELLGSQSTNLSSLSRHQVLQYMVCLFQKAGYDIHDSQMRAGPGDHFRVCERGLMDDRTYIDVCLMHTEPGTVVSSREVRSHYESLRSHGITRAFLISPSGFGAAANAVIAETPWLRLIDGRCLTRFSTYVMGSWIGMQTLPISPEVIFSADSIRRQSASRTKILAFAHNKGGVGSTTSIIALARELSERGKRVLLMDFDPQANLTRVMRQQPPYTSEDPSLADYFTYKCALAEAVQPTIMDGVEIIPASQALDAVNGPTSPNAELSFAADLHDLVASSSHTTTAFDWVLIDTSPALAVSSRAAFASAHFLLVVTKAHDHSVRGVKNSLQSIATMRALTGKGMRLLGVLLTQWSAHDLRSTSFQELASDLKRQGIPLLATRIPLDSEIGREIPNLHTEGASGFGPTRNASPSVSLGKAYGKLLNELEAFVGDE